MKLRAIDKVWVGAGAGLAVFIIALGYLFVVSPQKSQASDLKSQTSQAESQNSLLQAKLTTLRQQSKNLDQYKATLARDQAALPSTSGAPDFLRELQTLAGQTQVNLTSLTFGAPAPAAGAAAAAPAATSTDATDTTAPAPTSSASTAPGAIYTIALTMDASGNAAQLGKFLDQLQHVEPRAVLISQAGFTSADGTSTGTGSAAPASGQLELALSMSLFVQTGP
jgi:hypothetical protein